MTYGGLVKKTKVSAMVLALGVALAACASGTNEVSKVGDDETTVSVNPSPSGDPTPNDPTPEDPDTVSGIPIDAPMPEIPEGMDVFYTQSVDWEECGNNECAEFEVPLDYNDPDGKTITIAAQKHSADVEKLGSLLVNPGGPGGSGQDMASNANYYFNENITANFDIIGFDPRGVGESSPVDCLPDEELATLLEKTYPDTDEGEAESKKDVDAVIAGCEERSGELLPYVGTREAAQDMDVMRHVLGDPKLYYVGFSYGTQLGGMYAELFPENVGRLILDGAVDISVSDFDQNLSQLQGFELATDNYLKHCISSDDDCPFDGTLEEARAELTKMFEDVEENPIPTSDPDRPLTAGGLMYGFITPLYDHTTWPFLTIALNGVLEEEDGSMFQFLFDTYTGRTADGSFANNMMEANWAINCADSVIEGTEDDWEKLSDQMEEEAPLFGPLMGYSQYMCAEWPANNEDPVKAFVAEGSDPIVVVGTTGDPATPYAWSEAFAKQMDNAVLVTWEGEGHTAYGRAGDCITDPLDDYLLNGTVPQDGLTCGADE